MPPSPSGVRRRHLPDDFRFDARYGRLIRKTGIGTVPFALFAYQGELALQPQEVWFIAYILAHRWTSDLPFPSLAQMARNAGLTKRALRNYKDSLVTKGYLIVVDRQRPDGGTTSHGYDFSPLFDLLDRCITRDMDRWSRRNPQFLAEDADQEEAEDASARERGNTMVPPGEHTYPDAGEQADLGAGKRVLTGRRKAATTGPGHTRYPQEEDPSPTTIQETDYEEMGDDSIGPHRGEWKTEQVDMAGGAAIDALAAKVSGMLHDTPDSHRGTCTRLHLLWTASGLSERIFSGLMDEALKRTQQASGTIRQPAANGSSGLRNKVPYYLRVLENLVEERVDAESPDVHAKAGVAGRQQAAAKKAVGVGGGSGPGNGRKDDVPLWDAARSLLREQMTPANFATWLEGAKAGGWQDGRLVIAVADGFTRDWLDQRLAPTVRRALHQVAGGPVDVVFVVESPKASGMA